MIWSQYYFQFYDPRTMGMEEEDEITHPQPPHPKAEKLELPDGSYAMECVGCSNYCQWVEPNQDDGTYKCYLCRHGM